MSTTVTPSGPFAPVDLDRPIAADAPCAYCGYNLRGLSQGSVCPECAHPIARSVVKSRDGGGGVFSRVNRKWAMLVGVGLIGLLLVCPGQIWVILEMRFGNEAFGTSPRLNIPAPKVWAVPLVQRSLGYRPEALGVQGTWLALLNLAAIFLVTTSRSTLGLGDTERPYLRLATRWLPAFLAGGFFGFLMNAEYTYDSDVAVGKYAMFGVLGVELPCTAILVCYLASLAGQLELMPLRRQLRWAALATATLQVAGFGMYLMAKPLETYREELVVQIWSALYASACVIVALMVTGGIVRLIVELGTVAAGRKR